MTQPSPLYLGIDAGATKTFCLVGDAQGHILGFGRGATGNYEIHGVPAAAEEIRRALLQALEEAGATLDNIRGIGLGIAGADIPEDYVMLEAEIFTPLFGDLPRVFRNDSMGGLRGGTRKPYGIVIACGTAAVCAGVNQSGQEARVGGLSEDFGDAVGGTTIGMEGMRAVWRARDRVIPPTLLTQRFLQRAGMDDIEDLFLKMYRGQLTQRDLEPAAKVVFDAAFDGDAAACDILEWGGRYLGKMVNACAAKLSMTRSPFDVVMAGSVFRGSSPVLIDAMSTVIHRECPQAKLIRPEFEPVVGTLLLGIELDHTLDDPFYARLGAELDAAAARHGVTFRTPAESTEELCSAV